MMRSNKQIISGCTPADQEFMRRALDLALRGRGNTAPNPMVGAIIVKNDDIVGQGYHARAGEPHAEVIALRDAGFRARGGTLYCTLEPCCHWGRTPPCTRAVIEAGIRRVVIGTLDPSDKVGGRGAEELREAGLEVAVGCLHDEARRINEFFNTFHELGRPFITIKWAMTLDGRSGTDSNHSRWISNETSREHVHQLRAEHDAILIGIGTVLADDPMLNVRLKNYSGRQPKRIVLDGDLSIPRRARMLRERNGGEVFVVTTEHAPDEKRKALEEDGHRVVVIEGKRRLIDMKQLAGYLATEEILSVLSEGGRQVQTALIRQGLADKVYAYVSPKIVGGKALRSPVEDLGLVTMDQAIEIKRPRWMTFDDDACLEGYLRDI